MDRDIDATTAVDMKIASEMKDFREAVTDLNKLQAELQVEKQLESDAFTEATKDKKMVQKFVNVALKDEMATSKPSPRKDGSTEVFMKVEEHSKKKSKARNAPHRTKVEMKQEVEIKQEVLQKLGKNKPTSN